MKCNKSYAGLFPKNVTYLDLSYQQIFARAFSAFLFSPSVFLSTVYSKTMYQKSSGMCLEQPSRQRIFHASFALIAKIIVDNGIIIPIPYSLRNKIPYLFSFMTTDYHSTTSPDTKTHQYDITQTYSITNEHFSSNIPQFIFAVSMIMMYHNMWFEENGNLTEEDDSDSLVDIQDTDYIMFSNWHRYKGYFNAKSCEYKTKIKSKTWAPIYSNLSIEDKVRRIHFQRCDIKDPTGLDYATDLKPQFGFILASELRLWFKVKQKRKEQQERKEEQKKKGEKVTVKTLQQPTLKNLISFDELIGIVFGNKRNYDHPFFKMDKSAYNVFRYFSMSHYHKWTAIPMGKLNKIYGRKDTAVKKKVVSVKEKLQELCILPATDSAQVKYIDTPCTFNATDVTYFNNRIAYHNKKGVRKADTNAIKDLMYQKMEAIVRLSHMLVASDHEAIDKTIEKADFDRMNKNRSCPIYRGIATNLSELVLDKMKEKIIKGVNKGVRDIKDGMDDWLQPAEKAKQTEQTVKNQILLKLYASAFQDTEKSNAYAAIENNTKLRKYDSIASNDPSWFNPIEEKVEKNQKEDADCEYGDQQKDDDENTNNENEVVASKSRLKPAPAVFSRNDGNVVAGTVPKSTATKKRNADDDEDTDNDEDDNKKPAAKRKKPSSQSQEEETVANSIPKTGV